MDGQSHGTSAHITSPPLNTASTANQGAHKGEGKGQIANQSQPMQNPTRQHPGSETRKTARQPTTTPSSAPVALASPEWMTLASRDRSEL